MLRACLVGAAIAALLVVGVSAPAAAATLPPTLDGEALAQHTIWVGTAAPACVFGGVQGNVASSFCVDGTTTGPYPGTFHEEGTFTTVSTDPKANPDEDYGTVTSYVEKFTIDSSVGQVSGTESLDPAVTSTWQYAGGIGGHNQTQNVFTDYSAIISLPDGSTYADAGTTSVTLDLSSIGILDQSGIDIGDVFTGSGNPVTMLTPPTPPSATTPPTIGGAFVEGQTLNESHGGWSGSPTSYRIQWQRCDRSANNCADITGETATSYSLASADVGQTIRVREWAVNGAGTGGPAVSASTPVIQGLPAPSSQSTPAPPHTPSKPPSSLGGSRPPHTGTPPTRIRLVLPGKLVIVGLLRHGYTWTVRAPKAGQLTVRWYSGGKLIATGRKRFAKPGVIRLMIRLTPLGRRLLQTHRSQRVTAKATYTPTHGSAVSVTRVLRLSK